MGVGQVVMQICIRKFSGLQKMDCTLVLKD